MHVRIAPKPHIFANLDGPGYFGDRVSFDRTDPDFLFPGEEYPLELQLPGHIMEIPLGRYRRCSEDLIDDLESVVKKKQRAGDESGAQEGQALIDEVYTHVDDLGV